MGSTIMGISATLRYLKKKDASSVVVAILLGWSLLNLLQVGGQLAIQVSSLLFAAVDGKWASLSSYFGRSFFQQAITNILISVFMVAALELLLRGWLWYKAKR